MKTYNVYIESKVSGTAVELVELLSKKNFFVKYDSLDEFLDRASKDIWRLYNKSVVVSGETLEDRCTSFIEAVIGYGLLQEVEVE